MAPHKQTAEPAIDFFRSLFFNFNLIADQPEIELVQAGFPAVFEISEPLPALGEISYVDNNLDQIVAIENARVTPVSLDLLCFVTGRAKVVNDFKHSLGKPFGRHFPTVIELEG